MPSSDLSGRSGPAASAAPARAPQRAASTAPARAPQPAASTARQGGRAPAELRVDRVACTGHGMCAQLLPGQVRLDPWGYPIIDEPQVGREDGERAVRFCPARALYWTDRP